MSARKGERAALQEPWLTHHLLPSSWPHCYQSPWLIRHFCTSPGDCGVPTISGMYTVVARNIYCPTPHLPDLQTKLVDLGLKF